MVIKYLFAILILCYAIDEAVQQQSISSNCINPNRKNGNCISIYDCPALLTTHNANSTLPEENRKFLVDSKCHEGTGRQPYVCCNDDTGYLITIETVTTSKPLPKNETFTNNGHTENNINLLPTTPICGTESTYKFVTNKPNIGMNPNMWKIKTVYNGKNTELDEFPWMALLEYISPNGERVLNCGGSLINSRYVLTAAHCVTGAVEEKVGKLVRVRLGEYDTSKETDCIKDYCADPILEVDIEEAIPHEGFSDTIRDRHNDIALLRLKVNVPYTDFVRPICLPSTLNLERSETGRNLTVAGWGRTLRARTSAIKQKLTIPTFDHQECAKKFLTKNVTLSGSQLCAGGEFARDSCDGDSGGPLMRQSANENGVKFWLLEGVVSFGNRCGLENWPAIYTQVSSHENWINEKIKP